LLADKLVSVVAIHPLGGSRANRHHTPNPQPGAAQPTQDGDPQARRNPLELLFVRSPTRKAQEPLTTHRSELKKNTTLRSMILAVPSHLGVSKH
jgi:hypothetical protein